VTGGLGLLRLPVEADEDHIKVLGVVSEIDLGSFRNRRAIAGDSLTELFSLRQFVFPGGTGLHGEEVFDSGRSADSRYMNISKIRFFSAKRKCRAHEREPEPSEVSFREHAVVQFAPQLDGPLYDL
jgi:hypothetical protein